MAVGGRAVVVAGLLLAGLTAAEAGGVAPGGPAAAREPVVRAASVPTGTVPVLGDFDGDGQGDLLWYGPGSQADQLWLGRASRGFAGPPADGSAGSYLPLAGRLRRRRPGATSSGTGRAPARTCSGGAGRGAGSRPGS